MGIVEGIVLLADTNTFITGSWYGLVGRLLYMSYQPGRVIGDLKTNNEWKYYASPPINKKIPTSYPVSIRYKV